MQQLIEIVDELTYRNYKFNRDLSPDVEPARWKALYGKQSNALEARYMHELEMFDAGTPWSACDRWLLRSE